MEISLRVEELVESRARGFEKLFTLFLLVAVGVGLYALSARVAISIPFTPVPITGQTMVLFLLSALYGKRLSTLSAVSYISLGILGLPMFVGVSGVAILFSPTFGYLVGMVVAATFLGTMSSKGLFKGKYFSLIALVMATGTIYLFGVLWLGMFVGYGLQLIIMGVAPFIVGDVVKIIAAYLLIKPMKKVMYK